MIGDITAADRIYIVCGYTDMRRSIDGLCAIVQNELKLDPRSRSLFFFVGEDATGSSCSSGSLTDSVCYIKDFQSQAVIVGRAIKKKQEVLPGVSSTGLCQALI